MLLPFDPISLCMSQASAGILQGLGAKIKLCNSTDQSSSSSTAMHHLSSFVLLTLAVPQLGPQSFLSCIVFCSCSAILTMLCNPHIVFCSCSALLTLSSAGALKSSQCSAILTTLPALVTLPHLPSFLSSYTALTLFRAEHLLGGGLPDGRVLLSLPLFRPTTALSSNQRSSPSYTHPPASQYHPLLSKYQTFAFFNFYRTRDPSS